MTLRYGFGSICGPALGYVFTRRSGFTVRCVFRRCYGLPVADVPHLRCGMTLLCVLSRGCCLTFCFIPNLGFGMALSFVFNLWYG